MPKFSKYFNLRLSQRELDFVDINTDRDTPIYVDPYAIEIRDDLWAAEASELIRSFFKEVLDALRTKDQHRAEGLMSNLREPRETFLGVSQDEPKGRGVGRGQAAQLINRIRSSKAYKTGLLSDLSEMALYVENIDRDKISDLTTNIIRQLLVNYTREQCELHGIPTAIYNGPPSWNRRLCNWVAAEQELPYVNDTAVLLVPKYIVRRKLSLDSQEFYNKQITDFLITENLTANSSLVQTIKGKRKVFKNDVRKKNPKSKSLIAQIALNHPEILELYKEIAAKAALLSTVDETEISLDALCKSLAHSLASLPTGRSAAEEYHKHVIGMLTLLFYPSLIQPRKEWKINSGRKRVDIVFTNAADSGFFSQRRNDANTNANVVIVECKNYTKDIGNNELDQIYGRFDGNRGKLGLVVCRNVDDTTALLARSRDYAVRKQGYIIALTDADLLKMLDFKAAMDERAIESILYTKFRELLS